MDSICALGRERGLFIIEDSRRPMAPSIRASRIGSFGDVAAFSLCQDKIVTTGGEGGMFLTNDVRSWEIAWSFKDHGKNYNAVHHGEHPAGFRWLHESFGTNWRLTEMQSAMGRVFLRKLPWMVGLRRRNAAILTREFSQIPGLRVVFVGWGLPQLLQVLCLSA